AKVRDIGCRGTGTRASRARPARSLAPGTIRDRAFRWHFSNPGGAVGKPIAAGANAALAAPFVLRNRARDESMSPLRILVLTSSTGGGHDARAHAFARWVKQLYGWSVDVRIESMLEDSSGIARFGVGFYNFIQKHAPWLHHPYYLLIEMLALV